MDRNGRPDHIEDYLVTVRTGQWFGWSDSKNKIYANLIVHDGGSKPTETDWLNTTNIQTIHYLIVSGDNARKLATKLDLKYPKKKGNWMK